MKYCNFLSACRSGAVMVGVFFGLLGGVLSGNASDITIENRRLRLVIGEDACVKSLVLKSTGEECAAGDAEIPLFSVTQDRPFNNEIKLIHPNRLTTYPARSIRKDGCRLTVAFETAPYEAVVDVNETDSYIEFKLSGFLVDKEDYDYLQMETPPVLSFRVLQLPVRNRKYFGEWLNASWDRKSAIGVVGTSPFPDVGNERRKGFRILSADLIRGQKLKGASAALIAADGSEDFLDCMDALERDFDLPRGVASRRSDAVNAFIYHVSGTASLSNIDEHIAWARRGGFKFMTFHTAQLCKEPGSWSLHGDYDWRGCFPGGEEDVRRMLARVKSAGITPGFHFLHTHIGLRSRYVTPVADPRLHKVRHFTLAAPLGEGTNDTEISVFERTEDTTRFGPCRVLQFGGELMTYEDYTTEPPYRFLGVKRGAFRTNVIAHPYGEIGGVLDVSEYGTPMSCYLDQDTGLQEEIAAKIAKIYACGFEYAYFDGSEGVNVPCGFHVSNAQYRQWKMLEPRPLFCEGAAKTHFGWHILSGANAFDTFAPEVFKQNIIRFPVAQAPLSWQDMTRVNFGWWGFAAPVTNGASRSVGTQLDMWEFACSQCLAWNCTATITANLDVIRKHPRASDCFEVMRRWEDVRSRRLLSERQLLELRDCSQEHHLYRDERGSYELLPIEMLPTPDRAQDVRAFLFERNGRRMVAYWHTNGASEMMLQLEDERHLAVGDLNYVVTDLSREAVKEAWRNASFIGKLR